MNPLNRMLRTVMMPLVALAVLAGAQQRASARTLDDAVGSLAKQVAGYLRGKNLKSIQMGIFTGPPASSAGTKISTTLKTQLEGSDIKVTRLGGMQVRGSFKQQRDGDRMAVRIVANIIDSSGEEVIEFRERFQRELKDGATVDDPEDVAALLGATVDTTTPDAPANTKPEVKPVVKPGETAPPVTVEQKPATPAQRDKQIADAVQKPSVFVNGAIVAAKQGSPYRIEMLVLQDKKPFPRAVINEEGFAFCDLKVKDIYAIRIINDSEFDAGVKLTIDGLNMFEFSENPVYRKLGMVVIGRKSSGIIKGWHINDQVSKSFLITDLPDSAAAKLGRETAPIGTITASYFAAWGADEDQPPIELLGKRSKGTAQGPPVEALYKPVIRNFGRSLLAAVSVRYVKPEQPGDLPPKN